MKVEVLSLRHVEEILDVFCDAFAGYPVMRYVLGADGDEAARLRHLIGYFVLRRVRLGGPMYGVRGADGALAGVATVTIPAEPEMPPDLYTERDRLFAEIGAECGQRHETYAAAAKLFDHVGPHHHLNMLGVRQASHGQGLSRPLIEAVCSLASTHANSGGVSLTTETPANVKLYQHFGFEVVGQARVADTFETFGLFRRKS
jgi:GNAT superfamily N-acetyltransferase